jgi:hypothetical protein
MQALQYCQLSVSTSRQYLVMLVKQEHTYHWAMRVMLDLLYVLCMDFMYITSATLLGILIWL